MPIISQFFEFSSYKFNPKNRKIFFNYKIKFKNKNPLTFKETIILPIIPDLKKIPQKLLNNILQSLHLMLGISYYKLYCPPKITIHYHLSKEQADFWNTVYRKGLGEFLYRNNLEPKKIAKFPHLKIKTCPINLQYPERALLGIGGGKDSIVVAELLKNFKTTSFLIETQKKDFLSENIIKKIGTPSLKIKRIVDHKIFKSYEGAYNGHIPISAIFAFLGLFSAIIYKYKYVIVGNEHSSDFGNLQYKNEIINHQWSKSIEFETMLQEYTKKFITPNITYFSILRQFYEIRIAQMFAKHKKYFSMFSSCNKNFRIFKKRPNSLWCGECPKCVFIYLILSPFLNKKELFNIFQKNLFENKKLLPIFRDILGLGKTKPFDCVGTFEESQAAFYLIKDKFKNSIIVKTFLSKIKIKNPAQLLKKVFSINPVSTIPTQFQFCGIKNILILGYGVEGQATYKYLKKNYPKLKIGIADKKQSTNYLDKQKNYNFAIKTPGISKQFMTISYTTATNIFLSQNKNKIIGVTGSKGKSTTASLIYEILQTAKIKTRLLGNIGNPMLEILMRPIDENEIFILELSSYQLDDIKFSPNIAVIINLFPEHMTYHGDVKKYYQAKKNIINFQQKNDVFIYNPKNKKLITWAKHSNAKAIPFKQKKLFKNLKTNLIGKHNEENIQAAIIVAKLFNISNSIIKKALLNFKPLPHRLEFIGEFKGIKFYDDAISTTPESTIMAIKALKNIGTIFLGGEDRGYNFLKLEKVLQKYKIKNIILFPESGEKILKFKKEFNVLKTSSMEQAIKFAYKHTPQNTVCLLSCASPSYSLWKNFKEKGEQFKFFVKKYGNQNVRINVRV
jgi:UDP-N-acetylmuramoylalanine--D-glutamate ligase